MYSGEVRRIRKLILKINLKVNAFKNASGERKVFTLRTWSREILLDFLCNPRNLDLSKKWGFLCSHHL